MCVFMLYYPNEHIWLTGVVYGGWWLRGYDFHDVGVGVFVYVVVVVVVVVRSIKNFLRCFPYL